MANLYLHRVSIVKNSKGEIALKRDPQGAFSKDNAAECYAKLIELSQKLKAPIHQWSFWIAEGGTEPVLMADRYGNPRLSLLKARTPGASKSKVEKLA